MLARMLNSGNIEDTISSLVDSSNNNHCMPTATATIITGATASNTNNLIQQPSNNNATIDRDLIDDDTDGFSPQSSHLFKTNLNEITPRTLSSCDISGFSYESLTVMTTIDQCSSSPIPNPTTDSSNQMLIDSASLALSRLKQLDELLIDLSRSQINHLKTKLNETNSGSDKNQLDLFELTKTLIEQLNYLSRPFSKNGLYNADNGHSFMEPNNFAYLPEDCFAGKTVGNSMQSRNVAPIVSEYMVIKALLSKNLASSLIRENAVKKGFLKFSSIDKSPSIILSSPSDKNKFSLGNGCMSQFASPTKASTTLNDNLFRNGCNNQSNGSQLLTVNSEQLQSAPYRLHPFDCNRKHAIMASPPNHCIKMLNKRIRINSKKAAFQRRNANNGLHIYKHFDRIIEELPNGVSFKPMHRARKRRPFSQLIWMTDYNESLVTSNSIQSTHQNDSTSVYVDNNQSYKTEGSTLRARSCRRDYSTLFDVSSNDEDYTGRNSRHLLDDLDSDITSAAGDDRQFSISTSRMKRLHHTSGVTNIPRKSYLSKLDGSQNGNHPKSNNFSKLNDNNSKNGSLNKQHHPKSVYDYVILPAELMPVVHIEPIVYKEVVTPVWCMVDGHRMEWFKNCIKNKTLQPSNGQTTSICLTSPDGIKSDEVLTDDEHFTKMHIQYEDAEKERMLEKARQENESSAPVTNTSQSSTTTTPLPPPTSSPNDSEFNVPKKVVRSRDGRFSKLSVVEN